MMNPEQELDAAFAAYAQLNKSRGGNAPEGSDNEPAIPNRIPGTSPQEQREDNRAYMDTQYGGTEPRDPADERATRDMANRQRRVFGEQNDDDLAESEAERRRKKEEEDDEAEEIEKALKLYRRIKKSDAATRAIETSQDAYLRDQRGHDDLGGDEDDDIHGEPERYADGRFGEENPDDSVQITNMGRRVGSPNAQRKSLTTQEDYYRDTMQATGFDARVWNGNPGLTAMADVMAAHLAKSQKRMDRLETVLTAVLKENQGLRAKLDKSLSAQAMILNGHTELQKSLARIEGQPVDFAPSGLIMMPQRQQAPGQSAAPAGTKGLTKSALKATLKKGMQSGAIGADMLRDFDTQTGRGMKPQEWVDYALNDTERANLGL